MSNTDHQDIEETRTQAQAALNLMSRNGVSASPGNFEIWFLYATRSSPELIAEIDQIIEDGGEFTADLNSDLSNRFGHQSSEREQARLISAEFLETLRYMQDAFDVTELGQLEFHERLGHYSEQLERASAATDIARILEEIISDTVQLRDQTGSLKTKLAESTKLVRDLNSRLQTANKDAVTDPLTGISNRRYFEAELEKAVAAAEENDSPLSLIFLDIDHFKAFNDKHGHHTGDIVLRLVAEQIKSCMGTDGLASRYGGEEFVVLLKNTDSRAALVVAEKIRITISRKEVKHRKSRKSFGRITISSGLTQMHPGENSAVFLERADRLLYQAKEAGRNRVVRDAPNDPAALKKTEGEAAVS